MERKFYRINGKIEGEAKFYHSNGQLDQRVNYSESEKNGTLIGFSPTGELLEETEYVQGEKHGDSFIYENGELKTHMVFWEDKLFYKEKFNHNSGQSTITTYPVFELNKDTFSIGEELHAEIWLPQKDSIGVYSLKVGVVPMDQYDDIFQKEGTTLFFEEHQKLTYNYTIPDSGHFAFYCLLFYKDSIQSGFLGEGSQEIVVIDSSL